MKNKSWNTTSVLTLLIAYGLILFGGSLIVAGAVNWTDMSAGFILGGIFLAACGGFMAMGGV